MDFLRWAKVRRDFYEREGYYPAFGETQRRERGQEIEPTPEEPTRSRFVPRRRRRPWK